MMRPKFRFVSTGSFGVAIITCKECGGDVSSHAKTCPHCGVKHPILGKFARGMIALFGLIVATYIFVTIVSSD